ncbi:transposable element Tcb2 transposase [Trichonephila clavipes]|nr:transposable element Tcb2 transposase [Trichonephila clavipes]
MFDPSSFANPTPLAHADTSKGVLPRGGTSQNHRHDGSWVWYHARGNWTAVEWNQVVFSDESRFNLSSDNNRVRVWRPRGERLNPAFALQRDTAQTAGVMVSQDCLRTVATLSWPARSPDLSPIEHIWDNLGRRLGHSTSLKELEARLQKIWNEMSQDIIQNLYDSMPDSIASCIRDRGGSTRH